MAAASSFSAGLLTAASFLLVLIALPAPAECGRGEEYNVLEKETPQKNYTKEEEGKVAPYRTFLTQWEIWLICICFVIFIILLVLCCIYCYCFGCRCPRCCVKCCTKDTSKDYTQVQLHRERKIGEIWQTNY